MTVRILALAGAFALCGLLAISACSSQRPASVGGVSRGVPPPGKAQAGDTTAGVPVTKEVPHATETMKDIQERETKEPLPPRGDVAIPSHRIPRGDNNVSHPGPPDAPGGK